MSERISEHVSYAEAVKSALADRLGLPNRPDDGDLENMRTLCRMVFEPLRAHFGVPIPITSFYRSLDVNRAVGGSMTSEHCFGRAMDLDMDGTGSAVTNAMLFEHIRQHMEFDQLIWEFGDNRNPAWVHVGYREGANRRQVLRAYTKNGRTHYTQWKP